HVLSSNSYYISFLSLYPLGKPAYKYPSRLSRHKLIFEIEYIIHREGKEKPILPYTFFNKSIQQHVFRNKGVKPVNKLVIVRKRVFPSIIGAKGNTDISWSEVVKNAGVQHVSGAIHDSPIIGDLSWKGFADVSAGATGWQWPKNYLYKNSGLLMRSLI